MPSVGSREVWRVITKLLADTALFVAANSTENVLLEEEDATATGSGHAFYLISGYTKDGVKLFPLNDGVTAPGFFDSQASIGYYREYSAGPPPKWQTFLRITNLALTDTTVYYKVYRLPGLT